MSCRPLIFLLVIVTSAAAQTPTGDVEDCLQRSTSNARANCFQLLAIEHRDPMMCEKIPASASSSRLQKDICFQKIARIRRDADLCDKIRSAKIHRICRRQQGGAVREVSHTPPTKSLARPSYADKYYD